jgi:N6-adenosine-specific RNA methylase IME4
MTETPEMPDSEYDLIYADPPWSYRDDGNPDGGVAHEYETMSLAEIKDMDIPAADESVLYLWTTAPHAESAFDVINAWGFDYISQFVWDKQRYGIGHWVRGEHELLYIARKGDVSPPDVEERRGSIIREQSGKHSSKPAKVREYIEQAHPDADKLELFSRDGRVGWTMWGNETVDQPQDKLENYQ